MPHLVKSTCSCQFEEQISCNMIYGNSSPFSADASVNNIFRSEDGQRFLIKLQLSSDRKALDALVRVTQAICSRQLTVKVSRGTIKADATVHVFHSAMDGKTGCARDLVVVCSGQHPRICRSNGWRLDSCHRSSGTYKTNQHNL